MPSTQKYSNSSIRSCGLAGRGSRQTRYGSLPVVRIEIVESESLDSTSWERCGCHSSSTARRDGAAKQSQGQPDGPCTKPVETPSRHAVGSPILVDRVMLTANYPRCDFLGGMGELKKQERADLVHRRLAELYPDPPIPLQHQDPFTLLVAVVLSAQCTDKKVNEITPALFRAAPTPAKMQRLGEDRILDLIRPLGLSKQKAKSLAGLSSMIVEKFGGKVPRTFEELESLPGVGHKTASVVMAQAFGIPAFPVDTHIHRLAQRWGLSSGKSVVQTETRSQAAVSRSIRGTGCTCRSSSMVASTVRPGDAMAPNVVCVESSIRIERSQWSGGSRRLISRFVTGVSDVERQARPGCCDGQRIRKVDVRESR